MKCEENISNYKAMVQHNFDKLVSQGDDQTKALAEKYNVSALQEKIKGFKFTKVNADQNAAVKDTNWFQKLQKSEIEDQTRSQSPKCRIGGLNKFEMSKEEHMKFNKELL